VGEAALSSTLIVDDDGLRDASRQDIQNVEYRVYGGESLMRTDRGLQRTVSGSIYLSNMLDMFRPGTERLETITEVWRLHLSFRVSATSGGELRRMIDEAVRWFAGWLS
jgi:hypothetical protein